MVISWMLLVIKRKKYYGSFLSREDKASPKDPLTTKRRKGNRTPINSSRKYMGKGSN